VVALLQIGNHERFASNLNLIAGDKLSFASGFYDFIDPNFSILDKYFRVASGPCNTLPF
jgi:hypothetical protein